VKVDKSYLYQLISEVLQEQDDNMSASEFEKAQRADITNTQQQKGLDNKERAMIRKITDILKKYAQESNLAGGQERALLSRALDPLQKALEKSNKKSETK